MRVSVFLALIVSVATPVYAVMRGRDNIGDIKVNTLKVGDVIGKTTVRIDVDGDGRRDTLDIYFRQVAFVVSLRDRGEEVILSYFECGDTNVSLEYARSYLLGEEKPVMLFCFTRPTADGNHLQIVDVVRTADGRKPETLLDVGAGWADCPVVFRPGYVEMRHFRGWPEAKYEWDGDKFVSMPVEP